MNRARSIKRRGIPFNGTFDSARRATNEFSNALPILVKCNESSHKSVP